jgi:hypothetical protein
MSEYKFIASINIDGRKIDKANGKKKGDAIYFDFALMEKSSPDQYRDDGMVVQSVSKEARERGEKGPIVGNFRYAKPQGQQPAKQPETPKDDDGETLSF